jgi:hypothetical protein
MIRPMLLALTVTLIANAAACADVVMLEPVQVGAFYAGGATPDNSPAFQNYYVGYGSLTGGGRTPERRSFFHFDLSGVSGDIISATLELKLVMPGGLKFGKGPGDPMLGPIPDDPMEEFQLGGIFDPGLPAAKITSSSLTFAEITGIFGAFDDAPIASPFAFVTGSPPPSESIVIPLAAPGLTLLEMKAGSDVVLTGWMPTWSFDPRMFMGGFVEGSELIFGFTDISGGFPKPVLTIDFTPVPEASGGLFLGAAAIGFVALRMQRLPRALRG